MPTTSPSISQALSDCLSLHHSLRQLLTFQASQSRPLDHLLLRIHLRLLWLCQELSPQSYQLSEYLQSQELSRKLRQYQEDSQSHN
jgi:hypothetical protein